MGLGLLSKFDLLALPSTRDSCHEKRQVFPGHMAQVQTRDDCTSAKEKIILLKKVTLLCFSCI